MRLVRHSCDIPHALLDAGSVVTVGAYDGLHLGHRQLLDRVLAESKARGVPSVVMSFEPTPKEFFASDRPPARLMQFREKYEALAAAGIDLFFCLRFDAQMRDISAADFIRRLLVHALHVRHLVIGDDFRFARRREGTLAHLNDAGRALGFSVEQVSSVSVGDIRVSSTAIRDALAAGDDGLAARLLGRPYRMSGRVIPGEQLGRTLGYPTANIDMRRESSPVRGIYAVRVHGLRAHPIDGVASVGTRPTFGGGRPLLEVHLFDFNESIYGRRIEVVFVQRLREELKFDSADALVAQMDIDAKNARSVLGRSAA